MKNFYSLLISFLFIAVSFAQTNSAVESGQWDNINIWSLKRIPSNGDRVEIPAGKVVEVEGNNDLSLANLDINVFGTLQLDNGKLLLGNNSKITLFETARLVTLKGNPSDKINIGGVEKYNGSEGGLTGFMVASNTTSL